MALVEESEGGVHLFRVIKTAVFISSRMTSCQRQHWIEHNHRPRQILLPTKQRGGRSSHSPGEGSAEVHTNDEPVADGRRLPCRLPHGAVDGLGRRRRRVAGEVIPAVLVPLAGLGRPYGEVESRHGEGEAEAAKGLFETGRAANSDSTIGLASAGREHGEFSHPLSSHRSQWAERSKRPAKQLIQQQLPPPSCGTACHQGNNGLERTTEYNRRGR